MNVAHRLVLGVITVGLLAHAGRCDDKKPAAVKPAVIEGWGNVVDPDGDCAVKEEKGKVTITVPGTLHNLNPSIASNSPRVLQEIEGDFTATVKVTGDFKPGERATKPTGYPFNGAGLLIWQDDQNCVRLERNAWWIADLKKTACYTPLLEYYKNGVDQNTNPGSVVGEFFKGRSTYLRLARRGDKVAASFSHDGKEWTATKEIPIVMPRKVHVGVAAVNSSDKPFTVEFEELKVVAGK
jgi:regulation of enolase protein 1 (concanavalin A-like superfamily)